MFALRIEKEIFRILIDEIYLTLDNSHDDDHLYKFNNENV